MHSFLIAALNKNQSILYTSDLLKKREVDPLDINHCAFEKAIGIEDVRNIQKSALLKPFRGKTKAVVIDAYVNITLEAQNALLKILEEPPTNTIIVIQIAKKELLLPTIISRCKVVILQQKEIELNEEELSKINNDFDILLNGTTGDKLKIAQDIARDKNGEVWLEKIAVLIKEKMTKDDKNSSLLNFLKELQKTYKTIQSTNVSQRTALENLFLSF